MMGTTTHDRDRALSQLGQLRVQFSGRLQQRLERLVELVERARREPDAGALAEAISTAHRLSGTAGSYGYIDVGESVASLERSLQRIAGGQDEWPAAMEALRRAQAGA